MLSMPSDITVNGKVFPQHQLARNATIFSTKITISMTSEGQSLLTHDLACKICPLDGWAFTCDPQVYEYNNVQSELQYSAGLLYEYDIMFKVNNSSQQELLSYRFFDHASSNINKLWLLLRYLRVPFHQLASPPGFHVTHIPKENLISAGAYGSFTYREQLKTLSLIHI